MVVDASVWVSSLVAQDTHHASSQQWLDQRLQSGEALIIPTLALPEVAGAISRRTARPDLGREAAAGILLIPGLRLVALDARLGDEAARLAAAYGLRGADAVYVAVARTLNAPPVTLDQEVQSRAGAVVVVVQP